MSAHRILIVDGSAVSRRIASRVLEEAMDEIKVSVCGSGGDAAKLLNEGCFDIIVCSQTLPDMQGLELCRKVRTSERHQYTPFVILSSDIDHHLMKDGSQVGVTDFFDKSMGYKAFSNYIKIFTQVGTGSVGRVMYVEDSMTAAAMVKRTLTQNGIEVVHFTNVEDALVCLEQVQQGEVKGFDLVITDYYLENTLTGADLLQAVRRQYRYSRQALPVVVMTGKDDVSTKTNLLHMGANDLLNKPVQAEIMLARIRSLLLIKQQYFALLEQSQTMQRVAQTDALTGVYNRRYLAERGREWLKNERNRPLWALIVDIDHIKAINAKYGLLVGDHILASIGNLISEHLPDSLVARFGGEEFAVLLPHTPWDKAQSEVEALRKKVEQLKPDNIDVTISIGMAGADDQVEINLNQLISLADRALAEAKAGGRNRICYTDSLEQLHTLGQG